MKKIILLLLTGALSLGSCCSPDGVVFVNEYYRPGPVLLPPPPPARVVVHGERYHRVRHYQLMNHGNRR